jgi:hypothetical protein
MIASSRIFVGFPAQPASDILTSSDDEETGGITGQIHRRRTNAAKLLVGVPQS